MAISNKIYMKAAGFFAPNMWSIGVFYPPYGIFVPVASTIILCVASFYVFKWLSSDLNVPIRDVSRHHNWKTIKLCSKAWYCSVCESLLLNGIGVYCDCCGICANNECISKANKCFPCKVITSNKEMHLHHWIKGNLPLGALCEVCGDDCSMEIGLVDYECCWCHRTVHTNCLSQISRECDFGPFREMIVPPWCVKVSRRKSSIHRYLLLKGVQHPGWENWSPLIVVANRKSGNNDGEVVLSEFRRYLNPVQVLDLSERPPAAALQWCGLVAPNLINLLVAGGDGTVAWMLTTAFKMELDPEPIVSVLPLGTGNDLSRVLGWGKVSPSELDIPVLMENLKMADVSDLDRWLVEINPCKHLGIRMPAKTMYMYNYLSIGVDAQVALDFHKTRDSCFYIFGNRIFNKLIYLCFGTQQVVTADCKDLQSKLEVFLDGKQIQLPELESIVVLNIPSWGGGVNLWDMGNDSLKQSYSDGVLEVLAIYSSFHIAQLQVGISTPTRLGQAKEVEIRLKTQTAVQVDGEPWKQHPAKFRISFQNCAKVLVKRIEK